MRGEFEIGAEAADYPAAKLRKLTNMGVAILAGEEADVIEFVVPLNVAFFNPDLVELIGAGPILKGLNSRPTCSSLRRSETGSRDEGPPARAGPRAGLVAPLFGQD